MVSATRRPPTPQAAPPQAPPPPRAVSGPLDEIVRQLLLEQDAARGVTIGVTSAIDGEGKTTVARMIAQGLSRNPTGDRPVLLMDCDQHRRDRVVPGARSGARLQERTLDALQPRGHAGGAALSGALEALRARHAFIVLDMPALLTSSLGPELARDVDRLYLVVRAGSTRSDVVRDALGRVQRDRLEGVILNDAVPPRRPWLSQLVS